MKRYGIVCLALLTFLHPLYSQTLSPAITFEERVFDFGTILEKKGKVSHTFIFHNNGKTPVTIEGMHSGCGCVAGALSHEPVKPGGTGKVVIGFNPAYKSGFFSNEILVYSNARQHYNRIWVQGVVRPSEHPIEDDYPYNFGGGLYLRLKVMAFGYVRQGETKQMQLHYANSTNKEMTLRFVVKGNKKGLKFVNPGKIEPQKRGVIDFSYTMPASGKDDAVFYLDPYVNNKKLTETLEVKILNEYKWKGKSVQ